MDEEAARLIQLQSEMEQQMKSTNSPTTSKFNFYIKFKSIKIKIIYLFYRFWCTISDNSDECRRKNGSRSTFNLRRKC